VRRLQQREDERGQHQQLQPQLHQHQRQNQQLQRPPSNHPPGSCPGQDAQGPGLLQQAWRAYRDAVGAKADGTSDH
jgi:hypothetical protein